MICHSLSSAKYIFLCNWTIWIYRIRNSMAYTKSCFVLFLSFIFIQVPRYNEIWLTGDFRDRICTVAEIRYYFHGFLAEGASSANYVKPNKNCNLTSWVSGCEPGCSCQCGLRAWCRMSVLIFCSCIVLLVIFYCCWILIWERKRHLLIFFSKIIFKRD